MWKPILVISLGAALGALLRWVLGTKLNGLFPTLPPGTLVANLVGGYIIGPSVGRFDGSSTHREACHLRVRILPQQAKRDESCP